MDPKEFVPLSRFSLFRTGDVDRAREEVARIFCPHRLLPTSDAASFDARHHSVDLGGLTLNYVQYGADVRIEPGQLGTFFLLQIPLGGSARIVCGRTAVDASPQQASLLSPSLDVSMRWSGSCGKLIAQIPRDVVEQALQAQLGRRPGKPVEFEPALPIEAGAGRRIARLVHLLAEDADSGDALFTRKGAGPQVREMLVMALLAGVRHTHSEAACAPAPGIAPRHVRRAEDYIEAHAGQCLTLADIAAVSGVSVRALQDGFRRFREMTPLAALRRVRLEGARASLRKADAAESVTSIALMWGFTHLGRFSISYRDRFGEMPSQTLKARRERSWAAPYDAPCLSAATRPVTTALAGSISGSTTLK